MNKDYFNAIFEIIKTGHWITDEITSKLKVHGIYEPQFNVLRILRGANTKPISSNAILEKMIQRSSNITRIVDKLVIKELVERKLSETDRRKMDIVITQKGLDLLKILDEKVYNFHQPMMKNLTNQEAKKLSELIKKLKGKQI